MSADRRVRAVISVGVVGLAMAGAHRVASAQSRADASADVRASATMDGSAVAASDAGIDACPLESPPAVASANVPLRNLLGRTLREVNSDAGTPLDGGVAWRPFRGDVFVQFRGDRVVRVTARVPAWTECSTVARRFGFDHAMPPLRRARGCEWPARSLRHLLESGMAAQFDAREGSFEVWLAE
jgi:hypothetical protein